MCRRSCVLQIPILILLWLQLGVSAQVPAPIRIVHPPGLAQPIPSTWAAFGPVPVALFPSRGQVVIIDGDACESSGLPAVLPRLDPPLPVTCEEALRPTCEGSQVVFGAAVLVRRGGCTFVQKALNLQSLKTADGFPVTAVLVANTVPNEPLILIEDDGHGRHVRIPTIQTTFGVGKRLDSFVKARGPVVVELGIPI